MGATPRTVTADEALAVVTTGMTVASGGLSAEPVVLLEALGRRCAQIGPIRLISGMLLDAYAAPAPHLGNDLRLVTWFMPQALLGGVELGSHVDFLPLTWVQTYRFMSVAPRSTCACSRYRRPTDRATTASAAAGA
jgi:4-hydroxybutyrate CoA-transferase